MNNPPKEPNKQTQTDLHRFLHKLNVGCFALSNHNRIMQIKVKNHQSLALGRLKEGVLNVVVNNVQLLTLQQEEKNDQNSKRIPHQNPTLAVV